MSPSLACSDTTLLPTRAKSLNQLNQSAHLSISRASMHLLGRKLRGTTVRTAICGRTVDGSRLPRPSRACSTLSGMGLGMTDYGPISDGVAAIEAGSPPVVYTKSNHGLTDRQRVRLTNQPKP